MRLTYYLAEEKRREHFVRTGETPELEQAVELPADALDADLRAYLVARTGRPEIPARLDLVARWHINTRYWRVEPAFDRARLVLDHVASDDEALRLLREDAARYAAAAEELEAAKVAALDAQIAELERERERLAQFDPTRPDAGRDLPALHPVYRDGKRVGETAYELDAALRDLPRAAAAEELMRALTARVQELREAVHEAERAREAAARAERERRLAERRSWAMEHGSPRLRKCVEQGYDCQRLYVLERAAQEFPGYVVDFDDRAAWRDRSGPSEAALDEAARVGGIVVWLTSHPADDGSPEDYQEAWEEEREAVVIRQYLGRYDLIKIL